MQKQDINTKLRKYFKKKGPLGMIFGKKEEYTFHEPM